MTKCFLPPKNSYDKHEFQILVVDVIGTFSTQNKEFSLVFRNFWYCPKIPEFVDTSNADKHTHERTCNAQIHAHVHTHWIYYYCIYYMFWKNSGMFFGMSPSCDICSMKRADITRRGVLVKKHFMCQKHCVPIDLRMPATQDIDTWYMWVTSKNSGIFGHCSLTFTLYRCCERCC